MIENILATTVINYSIQIHKALGPGLLESVYKECLYHQVKGSGIFIEKEVPIPVIYKNVQLTCGFRIDLLVENKLVIEIKSVESLNDIHFAQILTYLKIGGYKLGLLINFNNLLLKDGIRRVIL